MGKPTLPEDFNLTQYLADLARRVDAAPHGGRGALIGEATALLGWTEQRVYTQLKRRVAWSSGRKSRADKGSTSQPIEPVKVVAAMQKQSVRKNGKSVLHLPTALSIAATNGAQINVSRPQFGRLMRDRRLNIRQQKLDSAAQSMRSLHPNHLHEVDPSLCLLYYLRGKQALIRDDQWYKNKPEGDANILLKVWRYVLYDHASAVIIPWYVEARGESADNMFQFLMHAWGRNSARPFHGAPKMLLWDKGSANTSHPIKNVLRALDVRDITHAAGAPRVKGGVENANNLVETQFESRLKFEPVSNVEELNAAAFAWANAYNANQIPHQDTRLNRPGLPAPVSRYDLWQTIAASELRILPDAEKCKLFLEGRRQTRKVNQKLEITYRHPLAEQTQTYDLTGLDGICVGDTVEVSPLVYGNTEVIVRTERFDGAAVEYRVQPVVYDTQYGFRVDAPVWGEEFRAKPDSEIEKQGKQLDRLAYPDRSLEEIAKAQDKNEAPFEGALITHSHLANIVVPPALAARRGNEIGMPDRARVEERRLAGTAALIYAVRLFGRKLDANERSAFDAWLSTCADGATETQIESWIATTREAPVADSAPEGLRLVK